jgi:hypothetical protein
MPDEASLTGVWDGLYEWSDGRPRTPFMAIIIDVGGALSGSVHEVSRSGPREGQELTALLSGSRSDGSVRFTKSYDPKGGLRFRPVAYQGELNADASEIEGTWTIPRLSSGRFLMIRSQRPVDAAETRIAEPASAS